ncbi:thioesterase family protein [Nocardia terpenica]|nr:thioesterase family protein [Nocardia terpenica]MBF6107664.1 thioesterase family protein [Nocardia terpenica]MBF6114732.1 thioesterase family protein [Nocardia terpenica]MBF6121281.1 thioesterase family protein [Nocardia terpenica]MBF6153177.1 thioesterase family protein [Nocardia terpenica]
MIRAIDPYRWYICRRVAPGTYARGVIACYLSDPATPGLFHPTELTRGPWSPDAQHGGAPSALLGYVIEQHEPRPGFRVARITIDMLGPVPLSPLRAQVRVVRAEARVARPGREVEVVEATLDSDRGPVVRATAWRLRRAEPELPIPAEVLPTGTRPGPDTVTPGPQHRFPSDRAVGFHRGVEYRFVSGAFLSPGPAVCWIRLRQPIVAGVAPSPLQRALAAADFGNGVSSVLPWDGYFFINTDLTVTLHRDPVGEWICLDAMTAPDPSGIGSAESRLFDERGPIGRGTQTLLLGTR